VRWLAANGHDAEAVFLPRPIYGQYLQAMLADAVAGGAGRLRIASGAVVGLTETEHGVRLALEDGAGIQARAAVLATGYRPSPAAHGAYRGDPWHADALAALDPHASFLLIGTGLTMGDLVISLLARGHAGRIVALSRRGLLPRSHAAMHRAGPPIAVDALFDGVLSERLRLFRRHADEAGSWRAIMLALRPRVGGLWQGLDDGQKRRFLRHLLPWWNVHRHRMAAVIARRIDAALSDGRLEIIAGRVAAMDVKPDRVRTAITRRREDDPEVLDFDRVIDCRGHNTDIDTQSPLYAHLLADGLIRPDALGLGLDVGEDDALVGKDGRPSRRLYALGPPTRGRYWEITAIPDIRRQAARLADVLAEALRGVRGAA
jgi:uncharacterized NAD(P)/FAD-binding protein YdhS